MPYERGPRQQHGLQARASGCELTETWSGSTRDVVRGGRRGEVMPGDDVLWHPLAAWHAGMFSRVNDVGDLMSGDTRSIKEGLELKSFTESKTQTPAESQSTEAAAVCCIVLPRIACQRSSCYARTRNQ